MISRLVPFLGALAISLNVHGAESRHWDLAVLMDGLSNASAGQVGFTERKTLQMLKEPLILKGTLDFRRPARLEKRITSPMTETYLVEGNEVTIDLPAKGFRQKVALTDYPALQAFVESIRAPLAGDLASLQRFYRVSLGGSERNWLMALVPLDTDMAKLVRSVRIKGSGDRMREVRIEESNGDSSVMTIEPLP
jgi:hypothetical protein